MLFHLFQCDGCHSVLFKISTDNQIQCTTQLCVYYKKTTHFGPTSSNNHIQTFKKGKHAHKILHCFVRFHNNKYDIHVILLKWAQNE